MKSVPGANIVTLISTRVTRLVSPLQNFRLNNPKLPNWLWDWSGQFTGQWRWILAGLGVAFALGAAGGILPIAGVGGALMFTLMVLVTPRPIVMLYALCLLLPITGGMARGFGIPVLRTSQALVVVAFGLMLIAKRPRNGKWKITVMDCATILWMMGNSVFPVLWLMYNGGSLSGGENQFGQSPLQVLLGPIQYYLLFRTVVAIVENQNHIRIALMWMFISSIVVSVLGILQKLGVGPVKDFLDTYFPAPTHGYEIDELKQRITSTLQHYSGLAAYLAFVIIIALAVYSYQKNIRMPNWLLMPTLLLNSIALLLTGTMAAWGGLVVGALIVFILTARIPKPVIYVTLGIGIAAIAFQPFLAARFDEQVGEGASDGILPQSMQFRLRLWTETFVPAVAKNWLFGAGPAPATSNSWAIEETQYLYLLMRGGIVYFGAYCFLMWVAFKYVRKRLRARTKDADHAVAVATYSILVVLNIMNIAGEYFTYVGGTQLIWTLMAICVVADQLNLKPSYATPEAVSTLDEMKDAFKNSSTLAELDKTTGKALP